VSSLAPVPVNTDPVDAGTRKVSHAWARWLQELKARVEGIENGAGVTIDASDIVSGTIALARLAGLTNAQISAAAAIAWSKVDKAGSSLADLTTRSAADLSSGTLPLARLVDIADAQIAAAAAIAWSKLDKTGSSLADLATRSAADLSSGTLPDATFPATLPAISGANLTNLNASNVSSGTLADARLSAKVPLDDVAEAITGVWDFSNGLKERGRSAKIGEWTDVAYSAGDFTASAGSWTVDAGDVLEFKYAIIGKTMFVSFVIAGTDLSAAAEKLKIAIPGGFTAANRSDNFGFATDNGGTPEPATVTVLASGTTIDCGLLDGTNWAATSSDNTNIVGEIFFDVS
jgi:hypothetical protein